MSAISAAIGKDRYTTTVRSGNHTIIADEPLEQEGMDKGMTPDELLGAALGACTCITLRMYADRKEWELDAVYADVTITYDEQTNLPAFHVSLKLEGTLDPAQKIRLENIASKCPVHKALKQPLAITTIIQ